MIRMISKKQKLFFLIVSFVLVFFLVFSFSQLSQKRKYQEMYKIDDTSKKIGTYKNKRFKNKDKIIVRHYPKTKYPVLNQMIEDTQNLNIDVKATEIKQDYEIRMLCERYIVVSLLNFEDGTEGLKNIINFDAQENEMMTPSTVFNEKALRYFKYFKLENDVMLLSKSQIQVGTHLITESELPKYIKNDYGDIKAGSPETLPSVYLEHNLDQNKKMIAITFDDGPHITNTPKILEISKEYDAHITFFMLGLNIERYPELVRLVLDEGHQVASHSYNHKDLTKITHDDVSFQINHTNELLNETTGNSMEWMIRPPYGSYNNDLLTQFPYVYVNWSLDTKDWLYKDKQTVCNSIVDSAFDGAIVLLHDIYETSVEGFECGIKRLSADGYQFATVADMFKSKNIELENGKIYRSAKK